MKLDKEIRTLIKELETLGVEETSATNQKANFSALITSLCKHASVLYLLSRKADFQSWVMLSFTFVLLIFGGIQIFLMLR